MFALGVFMVAPLVGAAIASGVIGGATSIFGGRRQQSAANAQAAAQMQFERENMFHQNQVALDFMREQQFYNKEEAEAARAFNAGEAGKSRDWSAAQAVEARDWSAAQSGIERTFNAEEAAKNRAFQEHMSNTQYQRATKDMMAAGINPMLAVSQGGAGNVSGSSASTSAPSASAPSGATASGSAASSSGGSPAGLARGAQAQQFNYLASAVSTAAQVGQMVAGLEQMNAQTDKTKTETLEVAERVRRSGVERDSGVWYQKLMNDYKRDLDSTEVSFEKWRQSKEETAQSKLGTLRAATENQLSGLKVPAAKADAEFQQMLLEMMKGGSSSAGMIERAMRMFIPAILKGVTK